MAINVGQGFKRTSAAPVDESLVLTKAQMLGIDDNLMPEKYFCVCKDDGKLYLYDKSAIPNPTTGKYSVVEGGGGATIGPEYAKVSVYEGANKAVRLSGKKEDTTLKLGWSDADGARPSLEMYREKELI